MERKEFMRRLEALLSDLPENERAEALQYYNGYLDDAGPENEAAVLEELGSPEELARSIRQGIKEDGSGNGYFSETGFCEKEPEREIPSCREAGTEKRESLNDRYRSRRSKRSGGMVALIVVLCIFAAPVVIPIGISLLAVIFALALTAVLLLGVMFLVGIVCVAAGACALIACVLDAAAFPAGAMLGIGISLAAIGMGILCALLFGWLIVKVCPGAFRGAVNVCSRLFHKKGDKKNE